MKFAIIISRIDKAGQNIKDSLIELGFDNSLIYEIEVESIFAENIDKKIDADIFIFATKHQSKNGVPCLSVHATGNWNLAEFGGENDKLCTGPANYLKRAMHILENNKIEGFDIIQEATHHGPYLEKPCMFIEIGSSEKEWVVKEAGAVIAKTIIELVNSDIKECKSAVGIGGLHHASNFKKIILDSDIAIGHVCPKYMLEHLTREKIIDAMDKTVPKSNIVIVDYKGLGKYKQKVKDILDGIEWKRTGDY